MTVQTLCDELGWTILTEGDLTKPVTGCYCGDLLSWVMSKAQDMHLTDEQLIMIISVYNRRAYFNDDIQDEMYRIFAGSRNP